MINIFDKFNHLPIRIKLTVWYTLSFMAVLAFSFVSFYLVTRNLLLSKIDDNLKAQAEEIVLLLKNQAISPATKDTVLQTFQVTKTNFVLVLNDQNEVVAQSQTFPVDNILLTKLASAIENNTQPTFVTEDKNHFYVIPLYNNNTLVGTVIVGDSIEAINQAFAVLLNTLILIFLIFLLPLILLSFIEADISLYPLRDLALKMNAINTKNLSDRVDILNPKDEIGEVSTAFNKLLDRIQKGFVKERQLIHDVSHQLKTPLTAMRSDIEIALTKKRSAVIYYDILKNLLVDTTRMADLLKDMMNFAWAASDDQEKNFQPQNISTILEEVAEITQQLGFEKQIMVKTSIMPDLMVMGQREKLLQIFINILENALKYSQDHGTILIQVSESMPFVKIIIKDNGIGIGKKDLPNIFERFYRGKSNVGEGSGLGLSIAAALVKAHRGTIEVTSQKHKGTTFVISFPLFNQPLLPSQKTSSLKIPPLALKRPHVRTFFKKQFTSLKMKQ